MKPIKTESDIKDSPGKDCWKIRLACNQQEQSRALLMMIEEDDPDLKRLEVERILKLSGEGEFDLSSIFIASRNEQIEACMMSVIQKDDTAIFWAPVCDEQLESPAAVQNLLLQKAIRFAKENSCELIQSTLHREDTQQSELFSQNGIPLQGTILFMQRPASNDVDNFAKQQQNSSQAKAVKLVPVSQGICDEVLGDLVLQTYVDSADFPGIVRNRSASRCLQTHRLQGEYEPEHWFVIEQQQGSQVGVLFFSQHKQLQQWELTYLGIIPKYRGKGIARLAVQKSLEDASRKNKTIFLGVDAENSYARRLYESFGFVVASRNLIHAWQKIG